jgi:glycerol-3-phosphate dehydrogenase
MVPRKTVTRSNRLGPDERGAAIANMRAKELDILVIGGGIVGTGAALDSVTRGLRTGLLEARDWASGTSSRSSKLVHGGIRYLEQLDFRLVREALMERGLLLQRLAPHLVKPVRFLYPLTKGVFERAYVGAGMLLYDALFRITAISPVGNCCARRRACIPTRSPAASPTTTRRWTTRGTSRPLPARRVSTVRTSRIGSRSSGS